MTTDPDINGGTDATQEDDADDITSLLRQPAQGIIDNLPEDLRSLEVLDSEEASGKNRKLVRRALTDAIEAARATEAAIIPEPVGNWPTHEHNGMQMCLVPRYRRAGSEEFHYVRGPLADIHPLHLREIRERLESAGGELIWCHPYQCDDLEWETLPAAVNSVLPESNQVMAYGAQGAKVTDAELVSRW